LRRPGEAGVEELLGELLAALDGGRVDDVLLVLLQERPLVRAPVARRLAGLGLQLRRLRRERHGPCGNGWERGLAEARAAWVPPVRAFSFPLGEQIFAVG
jgi:hypothetical protein